MRAWFWRWAGLFEAVLLISSIAVGIPALLDWRIFNGLDLLALLLFFLFLWLVTAHKHHDDLYHQDPMI